jgi:hypothetical protein
MMVDKKEDQDGVLDQPVHMASKAKAKLAEYELKNTSKRGGGQSQMIDEQYTR